jgi:GMP synthase (glutamine-hydrolysing)
MKILLIDNLTVHLAKLKRLLLGNEVTIVDFRELSTVKDMDFDLIVLSGGSDFSIRKHEDLYQNELNIIKNSAKPIIGICLGFQLICYAYGANLESLGDKRQGLIDLELLQPHEIFENLVNLQVLEAHRWAIKTLPEDLMGLARSVDGFEIVKHREREVYGLQFHPEILEGDNGGKKIFDNLLNFFNDNGNNKN